MEVRRLTDEHRCLATASGVASVNSALLDTGIALADALDRLYVALGCPQYPFALDPYAEVIGPAAERLGMMLWMSMSMQLGSAGRPRPNRELLETGTNATEMAAFFRTRQVEAKEIA